MGVMLNAATNHRLYVMTSSEEGRPRGWLRAGLMEVGFRFSEHGDQFGVVARDPEQFPSALAHVLSPADQAVPVGRVSPEHAQIGHLFPGFRVRLVAVLRCAGARHVHFPARPFRPGWKSYCPARSCGRAWVTKQGGGTGSHLFRPRGWTVSRVLFPRDPHGSGEM